MEEKKIYDIATAVNLIKENSEKKPRKFVETVDLIFNLNIDPKQSNQNIRGSVALPAGSGKTVKIVVFTDDESLQKESLKAGAVKAGLTELMAEIEAGYLDFDYCIATPEAMKSLSKVAKKLGPTNEDLITNIKAVIAAIKESKPEVIKNKYIKSVYLTTTMGPSVAIDITNSGE